MALGALAKEPTLPLRLVPVGLNYFSVRSRADLNMPSHAHALARPHEHL